MYLHGPRERNIYQRVAWQLTRTGQCTSADLGSLAFWYLMGARFFAIQENSQLRPNCSVASSHLDSAGSSGCTCRRTRLMRDTLQTGARTASSQQASTARRWLTLTLLIHGIHVGILSLSSHIAQAFSMGTLTDVSALQDAHRVRNLLEGASNMSDDAGDASLVADRQHLFSSQRAACKRHPLLQPERSCAPANSRRKHTCLHPAR